MNKTLKLILVTLLVNLAFATAFAQKKDSTRVGTVTGLLRDSVHNYVMQSATLAIYKADGDTLISYQLSNNFGKYEFKLMPVGVPLRIIATNIGYTSTKKDFIIPADTKKIDLKTLNMTRVDTYLKEVAITSTPPPMQMRGDTLEFNAGAFKLDPNAVVEDMLRKLPGVTVWGDGVITVNGKAIKQLLVDGKDFFGGDSKIALQNIPKSAIQKVQVYRDKEDKDPINPATNMNIVLKKDKKDGFFGKLGAGYGTDKRYTGDGMISYFSPKTQLNFVGTANNVNKSSGSASQLVTYNSFKGEGINNNYTTDFGRTGLNVFKAAGASYSHDFSKDSDPRQSYYKTNIVKADYFVSDATNDRISEGRSVQSLDTAGQVVTTSNSISKNNNYSQRTNGSYRKQTERVGINANFTLSNSDNSSSSTQNTNTANALKNEQSQNFNQSTDMGKQNSFSGYAQINTQRWYDYTKNKSRGISSDINYNFSTNSGNSERKTITDFQTSKPNQNKYFNRQYLSDFNNYTHTITTIFQNVTSLVQRNSTYITPDIHNRISFNTSNENVNVGDLATSGGSSYTTNANLTNATSYRTVEERPGLNLSKSWYKGLDNRFWKNWSANVFAEGLFFSQRNISQKAFQNLDRDYQYFLPSASFRYSDNQIGESYKTYSINYTTSVRYPSMYQLAPLNDDANVYNRTVGNPNLKSEYTHEVSLRYEYSDQLKNALSYNIYVTGGITKNNIADSNYTDGLGRNVHYYFNASGSKSLRVNTDARKIFKLKDNQFEVSGNANGNYSQYPVSLNGKNYQSKNSSIDVSSRVTYSYKGILTSSIGESFSGNKTVQGNVSNSAYYTWSTNFATAFALPKSIFFNTQVNFKNSKSSFADNIYYTIWNADIGYRFLKGNNGEIKFSALDLLHQNKNISQYVNNNTIGTNTTNTLQQYFMVTIAYYPRKFGLGGKK